MKIGALLVGNSTGLIIQGTSFNRDTKACVTTLYNRHQEQEQERARANYKKIAAKRTAIIQKEVQGRHPIPVVPVGRVGPMTSRSTHLTHPTANLEQESTLAEDDGLPFQVTETHESHESPLRQSLREAARCVEKAGELHQVHQILKRILTFLTADHADDISAFGEELYQERLLAEDSAEETIRWQEALDSLLPDVREAVNVSKAYVALAFNVFITAPMQQQRVWRKAQQLDWDIVRAAEIVSETLALQRRGMAILQSRYEQAELCWQEEPAC